MASISIEYHSVVLGMERKVNVIYPDQSEIPKKIKGIRIFLFYICYMVWEAMKTLGKNEQLLNACCGIPI